jgi:hypothetical protein
MSKPSPVLNVDSWNPSEVKYMAPKVNDKGGKSINVISKQTNRTLNISTPLMMTWGISDFVDEKTGESDGRYNISLQFPRDDEKTSNTDTLLSKLKDFENHILDDAVKNADAWFGDDSLSREVIKHMFFPILKYSKNKDTKKIDYTRPPTLRAKVPNYDGKWNIEIYDTQSNLVFPNENANMTPLDFVPKASNVACVLSISQIWIGGKGFGVMLKLVQCVVKPKLIESVFGKCHIQLSTDEINTLDTQKLPDNVDVDGDGDENEITNTTTKKEEFTVNVEDSDGEDDAVTTTVVAPVEAPTVAVVEATNTESATVKRKIVKKKTQT